MSIKKFKILSIDGGGIKGVFPAYLLMLIESELEKREDGKTKIYQHFDLITGTSTGGIIALALSFGIPAKEIYELYLNNAKGIFGNKKYFLSQLLFSSHKSDFLETLLRTKFKEYNNNVDPRLKDCKTDVCIPIYDLVRGNPSVLKTPYHDAFVRDFHIPAYQAAMATAAAPTYFNPYSNQYIDLDNVQKSFVNKVDGGVMANNPTLVAFIEAVKAFNVDISQLEIFSIGTGHKKFTDIKSRKKWGLYYWMRKNKRKRLIELFMQSQSQLVANYISLLHKGIDRREEENFIYDRIDVELTEGSNIEIDEYQEKLISNFAELASIEYQYKRTEILKRHFY
jgi:patatin-like phospholipase/acyl hydrolase